MDLDTAVRYYSEGLSVESIVYGSLSPAVMLTLVNVAQVHRFCRRYSDAFDVYSRLKEIQVMVYVPESRAAARMWSCIWLMQYELKNLVASLECYAHAIRVLVSTNNLEDVASTLNAIGIVYFEQGSYPEANENFANCLRIHLNVLGSDNHEVAIVWYNMARVFRHLGDDSSALLLYIQALRIARIVPMRDTNFTIQILQHLGIMYQALGSLSDALEYFLAALDVERTKESRGDLLTVARMLNVIGNIHLQTADVPAMMESYVEATRIFKSIGDGTEGLIISGYSFYSQNRMHRSCAAAA